MNRSSFKGCTTEMNGHVFECHDEHSDRRQYAKTVDALREYAMKNLKFPEDLATLFSDPASFPTLTQPDDPGEQASRTVQMIWTEQVKQYVKRTATLTSNLAALHAVIWGQCSEAMQSRLKALTDFAAKAEEDDCLWFLQQIRAITLQFDEKRNVFLFYKHIFIRKITIHKKILLNYYYMLFYI